MAGYKRAGALVLFEGLPPTVIDSQVLTHARLAREQLGVELRVIAFAGTEAIFAMSSARLEQARQIAGGPVALLRGVRPAWPGSLAANRHLLKRALAADDISFIHARGDYTAAVAGPLTRRLGLPMLWDCRGDTLAEFQERIGGEGALLRPLAALRAVLSRRDLRIAGRGCTAASFVSEQLRAHMAPYLDGKPSWVVPCLALEDEFFFNPALRQSTRARLGIADDEAVYIYSGSLAAYQGFDEVVSLFRRVVSAGRKARLVVLSPAVAAAQRAVSGLPAERVLCRSVALAEVNAYLNAADFGLLLRDATPVNRVAFPTKFAEYALTGLRIVMKGDPPGCVEAARQLDLHVSAGVAVDVAASSVEERSRAAAAAAPRLGRRAALPLFGKIYESLATAQ
ncbi:MAG TPA: hypothetical protein VFC38_07200 [Stellaceae bacterium]|nr:hypothetical protein [Stellaceae bacterium]